MWTERALSLPTPSLVIDTAVMRRNIERMASYARAHKLNLRPHTKTHKSITIARMQLELGATGLTVAKAGEARVMAQTGADILVAYPTADPYRADAIAQLALGHTIRVALDSEFSAQTLSASAQAAESTVSVLVDIDVGMHRTGVQTPSEAVALAQKIAALPGLTFDGLFFYPGHVSSMGDARVKAMEGIDAVLIETIALLRRSGLEARTVSGGSTPTALESHRITSSTEIRPGTYVFNDMNCVAAGCASLEDCAARIVCTVVSTAVPGQVVIDAGTKTLTSDRCGPAPDSGHGHVIEYPRAKIVKLTEEHGQIDMSGCGAVPKLGERVTVIPNHICPCVNLQDKFWLTDGINGLEPATVDCRGMIQ